MEKGGSVGHPRLAANTVSRSACCTEAVGPQAGPALGSTSPGRSATPGGSLSLCTRFGLWRVNRNRVNDGRIRPSGMGKVRGCPGMVLLNVQACSTCILG
eukprot:scaffold5664_cov115-Isochrysis_galbana.AAC.12